MATNYNRHLHIPKSLIYENGDPLSSENGDSTFHNPIQDTMFNDGWMDGYSMSRVVNLILGELLWVQVFRRISPSANNKAAVLNPPPQS